MTMNENNVNANISASLVKAPEEVLTATWLIYTTHEVDKIINMFDSAANAGRVHTEVKRLLEALRQFRLATDPLGGRLQLSTDKQEQALAQMSKAYNKVMLLTTDKSWNENERKILTAALNYTKKNLQVWLIEFEEDDSFRDLLANSAFLA
jgi:hypothetical protein